MRQRPALVALFKHLPQPLIDLTWSHACTLPSSAPLVRRLHSTTTTGRTRLNSPPKLRFAPSPTGYLHLGGLRTALFNHLLARKMGGSWLLRIEDTDQTRFVKGATESLTRTLKWAKLDYDEGPDKDKGNGPYHQSQRKHVYDAHLQPLIDSGKAYHCFCTPQRLADARKMIQKRGSNATYDRKCLGLSSEQVRDKLANGEQSVIRFKSSSEPFTQNDLVYDSIHYDTLPLEDFVLRKSDGLPTYHFANVVDDHTMGVTHVLRGEEWLPSTPKHIALYNALGLDPPTFGHLPLLINPDGSKLSKRAGDVRVQDYIDRGYEPEALLNFVALLGWSPQATTSQQHHSSDESDFLTLDQLIQQATNLYVLGTVLDGQFSLEAVNKNRATMSIAKLDNLNRAHVRRKVVSGSEQERTDLIDRTRIVVEAAFPQVAKVSDHFLLTVLWSLKDRLHTIKGIPLLGPYFFQRPDLDTNVANQIAKGVSTATYVEAVKKSLVIVNDLPSAAFDLDGEYKLIADALHKLVSEGFGGETKSVMTPLRHALTGQKVGAAVAATIGVLGKDESISRMKLALNRVSE
ncbi:Glutamate--tRNA ligase mitochondrial [Microbotryomycetes sp. JL201]|nr:Glutamate--tRNA ligase mitochondrial [Microbotryomycetes sp. JL201]